MSSPPKEAPTSLAAASPQPPQVHEHHHPPAARASRQHERWNVFPRSLAKYARRSAAVLTVAAAAAAYVEYRTMFPRELGAAPSRPIFRFRRIMGGKKDDEDTEDTDETGSEGDRTKTKKKKQVLVVPFHRIELKDKHDRDFALDSLSPVAAEDLPVRMEVRELVDLLHHAASDPDVVALYGTFGHGSSGLNGAGWADLEEVRNALKVFREAHRTHGEPNVSHNRRQVITRNESKPLYAYADTFSSPFDSGNKDYYIASIFTHLHLQSKGELSLFGMLAQQFFLRGLLEKYGIQLHVFKHGPYKNFPNTFTEVSWTAAHRENVRNILDAMNADVCADITTARSKALLSSWYTRHHRNGGSGSGANDDIWKRIHESGTFPAETAWKGGLVDFLPRRDPLPALLRSNASTKDKGEERKEWKPHETDFVPFKANVAVSLSQYASKVKKLKKADERKKKWLKRLHEHPRLVAALSSVGISVPELGSSTKEKIALLYVQGALGDSQARKAIKAIRKIGQDKSTKCLVLRVSSPGGSIFPCEAISEELKALNVPVVVSFGNVAASGGYYISAMANRVFASHKTVTGSIGVFGIRADLTGLTDRYGIKVKYEASGDLSATYASLHPMTNKMKRVVMGSIDRYYDQFKEVVSSGRRMSFDDVEAIAQGRVWTGDQAKRNGLVDELGGLHRAIAYARRNFTESDADIVVWPKKRTFMERFRDAADEGGGVAPSLMLTALHELLFQQQQTPCTDSGAASDVARVQKLLASYPYGLPGTLSGAFYAMDADSALRCLVDGLGENSGRDRPF